MVRLVRLAIELIVLFIIIKHRPVLFCYKTKTQTSLTTLVNVVHDWVPVTLLNKVGISKLHHKNDSLFEEKSNSPATSDGLWSELKKATPFSFVTGGT